MLNSKPSLESQLERLEHANFRLAIQRGPTTAGKKWATFKHRVAKGLEWSSSRESESNRLWQIIELHIEVLWHSSHRTGINNPAKLRNQPPHSRPALTTADGVSLTYTQHDRGWSKNLGMPIGRLQNNFIIWSHRHSWKQVVSSKNYGDIILSVDDLYNSKYLYTCTCKSIQMCIYIC